MLLRAPGSGEPPRWKSRRCSWRRCRRLCLGPVLLSCSSSSTYSLTLGVAAGAQQEPVAVGSPAPMAPTAGHVPTGIAVEGHVVRPAICIGTVSGDFTSQQVQGQLAPLEGHLARPFLQKKHHPAAQQPNPTFVLPSRSSGCRSHCRSTSWPHQNPLFPKGKEHPPQQLHCWDIWGPAGAHLGGVVVEQPLRLACLEAEAAVEVPQPRHIRQSQGQVAMAVDTDRAGNL